MEDVGGFELSANGEKLLVIANGQWGIVDLAPDQSIETPLRTGELETVLDPVAEWHQLFDDAWRLERDYFYDADMHGVDWDAMRTRYGALIDDAATRWDVNQVLGDLIGELNASHTYRGGGDTDEAAQRSAGLLGIDWAVENGAYRIARIIEGAPWDAEVRSPLRQPGVDVNEGDYVLAVNGRRLDPARIAVGRLRRPRRRSRPPHRQRRTDARRRARGARRDAHAGRRDAAPPPRVDRGQPQARGRGERRARRLRLRPLDGRRRAERARPAVHRAVHEGRAHHRRAVQLGRPDPRPLHRAPRPAAARVLGRPRRAGLAVAARRPLRPEGDAHQRLERLRRRRLPRLLPPRRARPARRRADVGRAHRDLRRARPRRRRRRDRPDVPHVYARRRLVRRGPRRRARHRSRRRSGRARARGATPSSNGRSRWPCSSSKSSRQPARSDRRARTARPEPDAEQAGPSRVDEPRGRSSSGERPLL